MRDEGERVKHRTVGLAPTQAGRPPLPAGDRRDLAAMRD